MLLRSIALRSTALPHDGYPFGVPAVRALASRPLELGTPVTFLVGENGSGKSTLLEAIACAAGSIAVGAQSLDRDPTLAAARDLAGELRLAWSARRRRGCFLRADDFFGYVRSIEQLNWENQAAVAAVHAGHRGEPETPEFEDREWRGGDGQDLRSHGEAFLDLFASRVHGDGLYLLDEPEAPLSPTRQIALLALLIDAATRGAQFLIATHSPILMALPGAAILRLDENGFTPAAWNDLEHVTLTRHFLNDPEAFLRHLAAEP
ncbi:MAG: AAA family ATPase [Chloroflexota bacterium]